MPEIGRATRLTMAWALVVRNQSHRPKSSSDFSKNAARFSKKFTALTLIFEKFSNNFFWRTSTNPIKPGKTNALREKNHQ